MTPEERTQKLADFWNCSSLPDRISAVVQEEIAAAIRAAVDEEREACVEIALSLGWEGASCKAPTKGAAAAEIATAIRKRGE